MLENDDRLPLATEPVDPDPFTIAACAFGGIAVVLQLLQTVKAYQRPPRLMLADHERSRLNAILDHVEQTSAKFDRLIRTVSREAQEPESQFFEAPVRIARTQLFVSVSATATIGAQLSETYTAIGGLANWILTTIGDQPELAARIGERIQEPLGAVAERLNTALVEGRSTGEIVREFRSVLEALAVALESELKGN